MMPQQTLLGYTVRFWSGAGAETRYVSNTGNSTRYLPRHNLFATAAEAQEAAAEREAEHHTAHDVRAYGVWRVGRRLVLEPCREEATP